MAGSGKPPAGTRAWRCIWERRRRARRPEFDHELLAEMLLDRPGPWMLTYGDHKRMRELYDHPGVKLMPIVYAGNVNASRKDGRTDLIIGMAAK